MNSESVRRPGQKTADQSVLLAKRSRLRNRFLYAISRGLSAADQDAAEFRSMASIQGQPAGRNDKPIAQPPGSRTPKYQTISGPS